MHMQGPVQQSVPAFIDPKMQDKISFNLSRLPLQLETSQTLWTASVYKVAARCGAMPGDASLRARIAKSTLKTGLLRGYHWLQVYRHLGRKCKEQSSTSYARPLFIPFF